MAVGNEGFQNVPRTAAAVQSASPEMYEKAKQLLAVIAPHTKLEDVLRRGTQYDDFIADAERSVNRVFARGLGDSVGRASNHYGYVGGGKLTEEQWRNEIQVLKPDAKDIKGNAKYLQQFIDLGVLNPEYATSFNEQVKTALSYWPDLEQSGITQGLMKTGSASDAAETSEVQGVKATNTSTDPATYTGWMKMVYQNALNGSGNAADYAPAYVLANDHYRATLGYVQQALDNTRSGGSGVGQGDNSYSTANANSYADQAFTDTQQAALDVIANSNLSEDLKSLYSTIVRNWDVNQAYSLSNIEEAFNKVKSQTIDPYYNSLISMAQEQLGQTRQYQEAQRALQLEQEQTSAAQSLKNTKRNLAKAGLLFGGEAVENLGQESAYAREGTAAADRSKLATIGDVEGLIPQSNRLIATSSQADYAKAQSDLALQAEELLGTAGASELGFNTVGSGFTGSIDESRQSQEASALSNLISQSALNVQQDELLNFT